MSGQLQIAVDAVEFAGRDVKDEFLRTMLLRMAKGEVPLLSQTPCAESKWSYFVAAVDPDTGRVCATVAEAGRPVTFKWGMEVPRKDLGMYVDDPVPSHLRLIQGGQP